MNRLESVSEALRFALNAVAAIAPDWLRALAPPEWFERYGGRRAEEQRLPKGQQAREAHAGIIGADGFALLVAVDAVGAPPPLRRLSAVEVLRAMWGHQYGAAPADPNAPVRWRAAADLPAAGVRCDSPYDLEAHYANKRTTCWNGYKVHLTAACGAEEAHLITHVATTAAGVPDDAVTAPIQRALAAKGLTPAEHLVDAGYTSAELFLESARLHDGLALVGPIRRAVRWQTRADEGFGAEHFTVNWAAKQVRCPQGKLSRKWVATTSADGHAVVSVRSRPARLPGLPEPGALHARAAGRPPTDPAGAGPLRGAPGTAPKADHARVESALRQACRHRGHLLAGRARPRPAPLPLPRPAQNSPPALRPRRWPSISGARTAGYSSGRRPPPAAPASPPSGGSSPTVSNCSSHPYQ